MGVPLVVVGVDGSIAAQAAVRWAAAEAASRSASLRIVHAFVWPLFRVPIGPSEVAPGLRAAACDVVAEAVELARKVEPAVPIDAAVIEGFPFPVLAGESRTADLVVVGSRGLNATLTLLVGSTTVDLVAHAYCPVVVVGPNGLLDVGDHGRRVVVGYDGSAAARSAIEFGLDHACRQGLDLLVVTVDDGGGSEAELAALVESLADGAGAQVETRVLPGHAAEQLIRLSGQARMVVVGSRGRGGFRGLLLGSVSQAVLQNADCPVAVVPHR